MSKPLRKGVPTFIISPTEYSNHVPHVITIRPAAIPEIQASDLSIAGEISGVLRREVQRVVHEYNGWPLTTINSKAQIILNATNICNGGAQTMDNFAALRDLKPQDILDVLEKISYANVGVFDVEWRLTIVSTS